MAAKITRPAFIALALAMVPAGLCAQETAQEREDRGRITAFIEDNLSGAGRQVILRDFEGALSSRATASQLTIADDEGIWLTVNDIVLDWNRSSLLAGELSINEFSAGEIIVERPPIANASEVSPEASGFSLPELPVSVSIGKISAARVVLGESLIGQPIEGRVEAALQLAGGEGSATLEIDRQDDGPQGNIKLAASYENATGLLAIDFGATEGAKGIAVSMLGVPGLPPASLAIKGSGPITDFTADVALKTDGADRLAGMVAVKGTDQTGALRFDADLGGDLAPLFLPEYRDFFGADVRLKTAGERAASGALDLSALTIRTRSLNLSGAARIAADGLPERLSLTGVMQDPENRAVVLPMANPVSLQSADLTVGYDSSQGESWSLKLQGAGLQTSAAKMSSVALNGSGRIGRRGSGAFLGGTMQFAATGIAFEDPALTQAVGQDVALNTRFWWDQAAEVIRIGTLSANGAGLQALVNGEISGLSSGFRLSGAASATVENLSRFSALAGRNLSGQGTIRLSGQGSPLGGDFDAELSVFGDDLRVDIPQVDDLLAGPSSVDLAVVRDPTGVDLRRLALRTRAISVDGGGVLDSDQVKADLTFSAPDLSVIGPKYAGAASGTAHLEGPLLKGRANIDAMIETLDLGLSQPEADRLLAGKTNAKLLATLTDAALQIEQAELQGETFEAQLSGVLSSEISNVKGRVELTDLSHLRPAFGGAVAADFTAQGNAEKALVVLDATAQGLRIGQEQADRLMAGQTSLAVDLRLENGQVRINQARLANPQLTAKAAGQVLGDTRAIDLEARLANLALLLPEFPGPVTVSGAAKETASGYSLDLAGTGPGQINARIAGLIDGDFGGGDLNISGTAQAGLANPFLGTRVLSGPVAVDLRLNGPFALSSLSGRASLTNGRLADATLPFSLTSLSADISLAASRADLNLFSSVSTGGSLLVRGGIGLAAPFGADLTVSLANMVVKDPQLYETRANGELRLTGPLTGGAVISGRVALPETEIRIASTGLGASGDLPELQHINEPAAVRETRRRAGLLADAVNGGAGVGRAYGLDLTISAPNRLFIRGRGLDAELGGELYIGGTTQNVVPSGAFNLIRGRLEILGRRLDLSEATLQLEGSFDPFIRIVAATDVDGISAGVQIEGQASDPKVSFTSAPEMPDEEILAQILFGKRMESLSALQALQLANAVATLAGRGGEGVVSRLRSNFGLDDLDVQTSADGSTQIKAGKYITENIYSEVTVDQQGKSEISLNLDLSDRITVKGRVAADGDTGLGVFYDKDY